MPQVGNRLQRELFARGGIDPMISQLTMVLGRTDADNEQHMKMQVQVRRRAEALDQCQRTGVSLGNLEVRLVDQVGPCRCVEISRFTVRNTLPMTYEWLASTNRSG